MQLGNFKDAIEAYKKTASLLPKNKEKGKVLYLLADAQMKIGETQAAQKTLDEIAEIPGFERTIDKSISGLEKNELLSSVEIESTSGLGSHPYRLNLNVTYGYDNNVFLLNDTKTARDAGQATDSMFIRPSVQAQYGMLFLGEPLSFQSLAMYTDYSTSAAKSFDSIPLVVSGEWVIPGLFAKSYDLTVNDSEDITWMNISGMKLFSVGNTLSLKAKFLKSSDDNLDGSLSFGQRKYPNSVAATTDDVQDGSFYGFGVSNQHPLYSYSLSESFNYTDTESNGKNFVSKLTSLNLLLLKEWDQYWSGSASYTIGKNNYPVSSTLRSDLKNTFEINIIKKKLFNFRKCEGKLGFAYENNDSNVLSGNYTKQTFSLGVSYAAF